MLWGSALLLTRAALSQMDVQTRISYVMAVVAPPERTAAAKVTCGLAPLLGLAMAGELLAKPFSGSLCDCSATLGRRRKSTVTKHR